MTTVLEEEPYAAVVKTEKLESVCSFCFEIKKVSRCSHCKVVYYCGRACQKKDWTLHMVTRDECRFFTRAQAGTKVLDGRVRLIIRLLIRRKRGEAKTVKSDNGRCFEDLMDHADDIKNDFTRMTNFNILFLYLIQYVEKEYMPDEDELLRYFGRVQVNSFAIVNRKEGAVGESVYLGLSIHDHSCYPDASHFFRGRTVVLRTPSLNATYSPKLTVSYFAADRLDSKQNLKQDFYFTCNCIACSNEERGEYERSVKCLSCMEGVCLTNRSKPNFKCDKCGAVRDVKPEEVMRSIQEIELYLKLEVLDKCDVDHYISSSISLYNRHKSLLSHLNFPLAILATKIVEAILKRILATRSVLQFGVLGKEYAFYCIPAYKRYFPPGNSILAGVLTAAGFAASFDNPPSIKILNILEEARAMNILAYGPLDENVLKIDNHIVEYRDQLRIYKIKY